MAQRRAVLVLTILAVVILVSGPSAHAAARGYVVNAEGLVLTLNAETDTVIGLRQVPTGSLTEVSGSHGMPAGRGRSLLTPQGDRILVLDPAPYGLSSGYLVDEGPTGRIFVYDVATGARVGQVELFVRGEDRLAGIHPNGDKVYVASDGPRRDQMTIRVVSLTSLEVMKELFVPKGDFVVASPAQ